MSKIKDRNFGTVDPLLQQSIVRLAPPRLLLDCRPISPGDELALLHEEECSIASSLIEVRRASGAARIIGRQLLARLGYSDCAIRKGPSGAPQWPAGVVGSLAHDGEFAVAAVALDREFRAVGVDIEPAEALPPELLKLVATPQERNLICNDAYGGRLLFATKEAVYKAIAALDSLLLDYQDIQVNFGTRLARLRDGRTIEFRYCVSTHLFAIAMVPGNALNPRRPITSERSSVVAVI